MSVIGVDVGTSRVKAVRFDADLLEQDSESSDTEVVVGRDGRREQDLHEVWAAVRRVLAAVVERSPDTVDLVATTAQGDGTWLVDAQGSPCGPALLWNDSRARDVVSRWQEDGTLRRGFEISGSLGAPGLASAQLRWLVDHDPARLERADRLLSCGAWVHHRLTGELVVERSDAANPFCDARTGEYDDRLLALHGLEEHRRLLPEQVCSAQTRHRLHQAAADEVGLPAGTPVVIAPYDVVSAAAGAGATTSGTAVAILGTTLCVGIASDDPLLGREPAGMTLPSGPPEGWLVAYATLTGTEALDWSARMLGLDDAAAVVRAAAACEETDLPRFVPYLSAAGERAPFLDADAEGALRGLRLHHGRGDVARAVVEGLTLAVADCLDAAGGADLAEVALCGGGARSDWWCQLIADATGTTTTRAEVTEVGALGAVMHGLVAVGGATDLVAAAGDHRSRAARWSPRAGATGSDTDWPGRLDRLRHER